ncbi:calmodulin-binding protein 60 D-like isoform X1 [Hordeum vulgare subsp. vulgare]|uniref:Calmodulin-binding protein n=1 Tax=Hordeum vulgare subsp. vulgare TaxID=112509 RepID=M0XM14_HORVV|nr:calmodulin-binding protein 60 D-like isoform X1 [Hordeum vulgare subsp. vulgare]XP_044966644.1 calmodulin-binding protein 60 D-like isoform X1 [Hordeum vulgare subsp. vulgare]
MQRQGRHMERSGSKRALDPGGSGGGGGDDERDPKRPRVPALASVIVEALKLDSLQKLCSSLEPILRRVVSEEVERALAKLGPAAAPARIEGRTSPKRIEGPNGSNLQLQFRSRLALPLFTGGKVEGEQGASIHVVLLDANTGHVVTSGPQSSAKLDVLVLEGDFNKEKDEDWTEEEFESHIVKEREGKRPLLNGDIHVTLKEGVGTIGELIFTDNSSWIRSRKFRLGMRVSSGFCDGVRIKEAKTEAFTVKDHRGELYKKHYPPALKDDVWRLEKIGKDGAFHGKLNSNGIYTVEHFLQLLVKDQQKLRSILGTGMSNKMWESLVEHAKTCVLSGKHYIYYSKDTASVGAIFNNIYEFTGLIADDQFISTENLTENQRVFADTLVKQAYDDWINVVEYDGKGLLKFKQKKKSVTTRSDVANVSTSYTSYDSAHSQKQLARGHANIERSLMSSTTKADETRIASNGNQVAIYEANPQDISPSITMQYGMSSLIPEGQFNGSSIQTQASRSSNMLAFGPPPQQPHNFEFSAFGLSMQSPAPNPFDDWPGRLQENRGGVDDCLMEEIRGRSHDMLENEEEMQHMLRILSGGAAANMNNVGGFPSYPSPVPDFNFVDDRAPSSGKAVVGWLKIKAAMRWGIFVRKKAAERRAQLVELDD